MIQPIDKYKELMNINGISKIASDTLFKKYIILNQRGEAKLWEIDSTDQESLLAKKNGGYPLPGLIYTFFYPKTDALANVVNNGRTSEYYDMVPLVFCLSFKDGMLSGINMNLLPPFERLKFLQVYYQFYKSFFEKVEDSTENHKLALNKRFISLASSPQSKEILKLFMSATNSNFNFAFRKYNMQKIQNLRMIEYTEWDYIPFYEPSNAFKGMNFKQLYDIYWKSR